MEYFPEVFEACYPIKGKQLIEKEGKNPPGVHPLVQGSASMDETLEDSSMRSLGVICPLQELDNKGLT